MDKIHNLIYFLKFFLSACLCIFAWQTPAWAQNAAASESSSLQQKLINNVQFTEKTSTPLQGVWQYYPEQFITQPSSVLKSTSVSLPTSFKELTGTNETYGTFIAHFKVPKEYLGRNIAIFIPNQYSAYRLYLNGDYVLRLGLIGKNAKNHQTENAPRIAFIVPKTEDLMVTLQVSNFKHLHGGIENPIRIGTAKTITRQFEQLMMSIGLVCGAVFGLGIFTLMFSISQGKIRRSSIRVFVFGLFILFLALHNLFSAPYAYTTFTDISWLWGERLEYLFTNLAIAFFLSYMYLLNRRYLNLIVYAIALILITMNIVMIFFTTPEVFQRLAFYSSIFSLAVILNFAHGFYLTLKYKEKPEFDEIF